MINHAEAKQLLSLPKVFEEKNGRKKQHIINLEEPNNRFILTSPEDDEWKFLFEIYRSKKIRFKISLHHQENVTKEGLLRVDYTANHVNPEIVNEYVPDFLHQYVGARFVFEPHIHFSVETYKSLAWAMPLKDYQGFDVKEIKSTHDFSIALRSFAKAINLVDEFTFKEHNQLRLL